MNTAFFILLMASVLVCGNTAPAASFLEIFGSNATAQCDEYQRELMEFDQYLQKNNAEIKDFLLDFVCPLVHPYEKKCQDFINNDLTKFVQQLHKALADPKKICQHIGFCSETVGQFDGLKIEQFAGLLKLAKMRIDEGKKSDKICTACMNEIAEIDAYTVKYGPKIIGYLENGICPQIPHYEKECKIWVQKNIEPVFEKLHDEFKNPKEFCQRIRLC